MRSNQDFIEWKKVSQHQILQEPFILEFANRLDWVRISQYQTLSSNFIRDNVSRLDMSLVSRCQTLNIPTIELLQKKLDMRMILRYQNLTDDFLLTHIREFEVDGVCDALVLNKNVSQGIVEMIFKRCVLQFLKTICQKLPNTHTDIN